MIDFDVKNQIYDLTTQKIRPVIDNVYKESLRELIAIFGGLYYIDGNSNKVKVKCVHGNPERISGRLKADTTLILPMISVVETQTSNDERRRRYQPLLINERAWDDKKLRATRVLSLSPRPVNLTYEISIWSKYKADMDMLRSTMYNMFNPDLNVRTKYSDYNKCFMESEQDLGSVQAPDAGDRILKKSITAVLETYIPSPKFLFTNTGEIISMNNEVVITNDVNSARTYRETMVDNLTSIIID